ncbi:hypothetical protein [Bacillus sp. ISL-18]|uniref:hypothetical protein n=1 Tax=Bacillus sp. ISL-18 TaxID=2819118 RepID=UPI0027E0C890|nr:hypothetical protein [Bacillus sp. ISL-18]
MWLFSVIIKDSNEFLFCVDPELLGKALQGGKREQAIVATKFTFGPNWQLLVGILTT